MAHDQTPPRNVTIALIAVITTIFISVCCLALFPFFFYIRQRHYDTNVVQQEAQGLLQLRAYEIETLGSYEIDATTGRIQIPIEQAMKLEAERPWRSVSGGLPSLAPAPVAVDSATTATETVASESAAD